MKKIMILFASLCLIFSGCGNKEVGKQPIKEINQDQTEETDKQSESEELLKDVSVKFDLQDIVDGKRKIVVWVKNDTSSTFTGDLFISTSPSDFDMIFAKDIKPYDEKYGIIFLKADTEDQLNYSWSEYSFDIKDNGSEELSQELTDKVKIFAEETWGGEWGATWYKSYEDIKVYKQGDQTFVTFITAETDESTLSLMCDGLLQYDDQWIDYAQSINKDDSSRIFKRANPFNQDAWK